MKLITLNFKDSRPGSWLILSQLSGLKVARTMPQMLFHICNPVSDPQPHELLAELDLDNNPDISFMEVRSITNENLRLTDLHKTVIKTQNINS